MKTAQGANAFEHSLNHGLEFFSKAGSLYATPNKKGFYEGEATAKQLFVNVYAADKVMAMALLLWLRDCRGGAGNRSGSREIYQWLAETDPALLQANLHQLPQVGRYDDYRCLFGTKLEKAAAGLWSKALFNREVLSAKWADRKDKPLRQLLGMNAPEFRKFLVSIRGGHIVESKMCAKEWDRIKYDHVPSVAMSRYTNAFRKHDETRFNTFKEQVKSGEKTVHADVLFPHDCVITARYGDPEMAELQFNALPNFLQGEDVDERILVIADSSGSMEQEIGAGKAEALHVSIGMALYCSAKMREDSPFYKRFIAFESEGSFKDWRHLSFSQAIRDRDIFDGAIGSTRIDSALDLILNTAIERKIPQELMPTTLMIVSDMQFSSGSHTDDTEVEYCLKKFDAAGYDRPKILYWNLAGYQGSQATASTPNVGMVSGYSPAILKSVLGGTDFSPIAIMLRTLEKYEVVLPEVGIVV